MKRQSAACTTLRAMGRAAALFLAASALASDQELVLWYANPAEAWTEALPLGNGRLGAMVFGGEDQERIQLNEDSLWSGAPGDDNRPEAHRNLPEIRRLLLEGKNVEAEQLVMETFTCKGKGSGRGNGANVPFGCYQTLGDLRLTWSAPGGIVPLQQWKQAKIDASEITQAAQPDLPDKTWGDYQVVDGKVTAGSGSIAVGDWVVIRHHLRLSEEQAKHLGRLHLGPLDDTSVVFVNGTEAGRTTPADWNAPHRFDIRKHLRAGENVIAIAASNIGGPGKLPSRIQLEPGPAAADYYRDLDLRTAIATVRYRRDGIQFTRELLASAPDQVVVIRLTADRAGSLSFTATLDRPERFSTGVDGTNGLLMTGRLNNGTDGNGMKYAARLRVLPSGGQISAANQTVRVAGADEVLLLVAAATDYQGFAGRATPDPLRATQEDLNQAAAKSFEALRAAHLADHHKYFDRVSLVLRDGKISSREAARRPTDERLKAIRQGASDPALAALYFHYGRYLLLSSSRPGTLPANLQGIWAEEIQTPWNGDYHLDINVQMNYWPAEVCNLSDCHLPLLKLIESLQTPGAATAKAYYDANGWVAHVITNPWGFTAPGEHASWGATASGSAWLCEHLWEHYAFTGDKNYLQWAYPIMKGSAQFYLDMLIEEPTHGWLVTAPSNSPENAFRMKNGQVTHTCLGPTMDLQILRELFGNCIRAAEILGIDASLRNTLRQTCARLAPNQIGRHGQLQEWLEDYEEPEPHHRHMSHLYGLYPFCEITPDRTPDLAQATRVTLERRGDGNVGWAFAWKIAFWARLRESANAHKFLRLLLERCTNPNLFNMCFASQPLPFQIDANFAATAGLAEMLLQSHLTDVGNSPAEVEVYTLDLLPALPDAWPEGKVTGLRGRGGFEVDIEWREGRLLNARVQSLLGHRCAVRYGDKTIQLETRAGQTYRLNPDLE